MKEVALICDRVHFFNRNEWVAASLLKWCNDWTHVSQILEIWQWGILAPAFGENNRKNYNLTYKQIGNIWKKVSFDLSSPIWIPDQDKCHESKHKN